MDRKEALDAVSRWFGTFPYDVIVNSQSSEVEVYEIIDGYSIGYTKMYHILVGSNENCNEMIGKCVTCCVENRFIPTYLAVPSDCPHLDKLEQTMKRIDLPIGLIAINNEGKIRLALKPHLP